MVVAAHLIFSCVVSGLDSDSNMMWFKAVAAVTAWHAHQVVVSVVCWQSRWQQRRAMVTAAMRLVCGCDCFQNTACALGIEEYWL
jgi:hypothetical protein